MSALFWQELVLIIFAVLIGMPIGCFLRRYFSAKSSEPSGRAAHTASTRRAAAPAAATAASTAKTAAEPSVAAEALAVETTQKLAEQQAELDAAVKPVASTSVEEKAETIEDKTEETLQSSDEQTEAPKDAQDQETSFATDVDAEAELEASILEDTNLGSAPAPETKAVPEATSSDGDVDLEAEEARIAAALAALPKGASAEQKADAAGSKPVLLTAPRGGKSDDLKRIKGVGKVIETKLNALGVHHFDQVANWSRDEVNWVTTFLSFKGRVDREEWIPQARGLMQTESTEAVGLLQASDTKTESKPEAQPEPEVKAKPEAKPVSKAKPKAPAKRKPAAPKAKPKAPETKAAVAKETAAANADADLNANGSIEDEEKRIAAAIAALPKDASSEDKANVAGKKPRVLKNPRKAGPDDLKRIKGVGKVIEGKLNDLGIYHFDQIAKWNRSHINWVTTFLSFKGRVDRENWIEQAKLLASGEETEFSKRVDKGEVESSKD